MFGACVPVCKIVEPEPQQKSTRSSTLVSGTRKRRAADEQRLEAAVAATVAQMAKANSLIPQDLNKAFEALLEAEEELDQGLGQLVGQDRLADIVHTQRQRRSSGNEGAPADEFSWLLRQLELSDDEAKKLHLASVEDIRRYARGRLREQQQQQEAKGSLVFPESKIAVDDKRENADGLSVEDIVDALRSLRKAVPTEVEAAAMGAVEVGKHFGSRLQPLVTDSYRTMAYKVLPQARKTLVDSMSPEVKDFARQGRNLVNSGAEAASNYASPRMARLRDNLSLLRSQIQQVPVT
jgi:hypothetical protein